MSSYSHQSLGLPIFSFSKYQKGQPEEKLTTAKDVVDAFKTYGFVYLVDHGISDGRIQDLFDWSKKFFYLSESVLTSPELIRPVSVPGQKSFMNRGYAPVGTEKLSQALDPKTLKTLRAIPDAKDLYEMGPDKGPGAARQPNKFPGKGVLPGFEEFTMSFFWEAHELALDILRCIATGLGLEENYFVDYHEDADNLFRLIRYPPVERAAIRAKTTARTSAHTDFGSITLLFQDDVGGLEVEDPAKPGTYISATPVAGSIVVNVGDFLMRWTNDTLKSNVHRVVEPPAERELPDGKQLTRERFSIPYFVQADRKKIVECVEELRGSGAKYPPVSAGEYIDMRTGAVFTKY